ncbi:MAG: B12-binding domain-containing radical SAM protein [bacterium]|nr:B12-binding domain-containing radical SAM protein [bacterium]
MKITLIRPNLRETRSSDALEPLCFAILKALTPPGVEIACYDERIEPVRCDEPTDLAALTVETHTARRSYQIAAEYRRRGVKVVMGGCHPTLLPEEALRFTDAVVRGDAEGVWRQLVADAANGRLQRVYDGGFPSLAGPPPDRSVFRARRYAPIALVQWGRGCRYACDFCSIRAFYGSRLRQRPVREVVDEIEKIGRKRVFFVDDNLFADPRKAKELVAGLVPLRIRWSCQISIDVAGDRELVKLLEKSGCTAAVVGFESLDEGNLRQMKKSSNLKHGDYATAIRILRDAGMMIYGTFVFGYDRDTVDSFDVTLEFALRHHFFLANFNPLTPTPGTPLFDRLKREQRLIYDRWWLDPRYRYGEAIFHPRGMSAEELTRGCYRARSEFNTYGAICRRLFNPRAHLRSPHRIGTYLAANLISRKEIHAKQGMALGDPTAPDLREQTA